MVEDGAGATERGAGVREMSSALVPLPATREAASLARRHVADLADSTPLSVIDDALLIASELVTNAVRHGGAAITLQASFAGGQVHIAVHDSGPQLPVRPDGPPGPTEPGGRGLLIVSTLALRWGVVLDDPPPGKTVWADLDG